MFIAMNRFKIKPGCEQDFIAIWEGRDTFLQEVPGFKSFNLLQGQSTEEYTLFSSHATWEAVKRLKAGPSRMRSARPMPMPAPAKIFTWGRRS